MPLISTRALTKRYGSSVIALDALTLDVEPGIIGLVGANGAGKSTLLSLIGGLERPQSGRLRVGDPAVVYPVFQKVRTEVFAGRLPASTSVFVAALLAGRCEIKLVAAVPDQ